MTGRPRSADRIRDGAAALPRLLDAAPAGLLLAAGAVLLGLGVVIVGRPLTSVTVLAAYLGASCLVTGVAELVTRRRGLRTWDLAVAVAWVLAGALVLLRFDRSLLLLPDVLAVVLLASGVGRLAGVLRGGTGERVLAGASGASEVTFGVLALLWPDATLVVVAVLFGARTIVFAVTLLWRGGRALVLRGRPAGAATGRRPGRGADALRWVAAAAVLVLAAGAGLVSHGLRSGLPVLDAFYATPADVPGRPGALLRAEPWPGVPPAGADVIRILYTTTGSDGSRAVASAVVVLPREPADEPLPVIAWDHGTTGVARSCAPSLMRDMFEIQGVPAAEAAVASGWAIVATDYTGQGAAGDFPYLIGQGEARSTLDAVRAAHGLDDVDLSEDTVIWGHSQGGHAALWTAQLAADYAPGLTVRGVAALSPAADPYALASAIQEQGVQGPLGVIASWVLVPSSTTYADVRIADYVAPAGRGLVAEYATRCATDGGMLVSVLSSAALAHDQPLYVSDLVGGAVGERLRENAATGPFPAPVLVAWGSEDEVIPARLQHRWVDALCAAGQPLEHREYPGRTHMSVLDEDSGLPAALVAWTRDRLAGTPPVDSCPTSG